MTELWSGGVIVMAVVLLWFAFLIPGMHRQRQYRATVRNTDRLQRTLRVLADGAGTPTHVSIDADSEEVAEQKRILRAHEIAQGRTFRARRVAAANAVRERREAAAARRKDERVRREEERRMADEVALQERRDAQHDPVVAERLRRRELARSRRRARLVASCVLLVSVPVIGVGTAAVVGGGGFWILAVGVALAVLAVAALRRMATIARRAARRTAAGRSATTTVEGLAQPLFDQETLTVQTPRIAQHKPLWDAQPLPEALQSTSGSLADEALARARAQEELRRAAREQVMAEMAQQRTAESVHDFAAASRYRQEDVRQRWSGDIPVGEDHDVSAAAASRSAAVADSDSGAGQAPATESNPFAAMGRVGNYSSQTDVSDILRRRRNAG